MTIQIALIRPADHDRWESLFRGYVASFDRVEPQSMYDRTWSEIQRSERMHGRGAMVDGELVGIVHFLPHACTMSRDVCYLEDLFVAPAVRGTGIGRALINCVVEWARTHDCDRVYWHTRTANATARRLYDSLAEDRGEMVYRIQL